MVNESKVKMMTKMAVYEKREGKEDIAVCRFFKSDYVGLGIIKTAVAVTVSSLLIGFIYVICNIDSYLKNVANLNYKELVWSFGGYYLAALIVFAIISFFFYSYRYDEAARNIKAYTKRLKILDKYYKRGGKKK